MSFSERDPAYKNPYDPDTAYDVLKEFLAGNPDTSLAQVRDSFRMVAEYEVGHKREAFTLFPQDVAVCAFLGLNPRTGQPSDAESILAEFNPHTDENGTRNYYRRFMENQRLQEALAEEATQVVEAKVIFNSSTNL